MKEPNTTVRIIKVKDLRIHPIAQRELRESKVAEFMNSLNLDAIGTIHAVLRKEDGFTQLYVVDGQHRVVTLRQAGLGDLELTVIVHRDVKDDAAAARLFLDLNNRTPVTSFDKFKNEVTAGGKSAVAVTEIAQSHGLKVGPVPTNGTICCVGTLKKLAEWGLLDATLSAAEEAWGKKPEAREGKVLEGLAMVLRSFNGDLDRDGLRKKLAKYPGGPSALLGAAKNRRQWDRGSLPRCVARTIIAEYNKGRRNQLEL